MMDYNREVTIIDQNGQYIQCQVTTETSGEILNTFHNNTESMVKFDHSQGRCCLNLKSVISINISEI